jgi:exosortase
MMNAHFARVLQGMPLPWPAVLLCAVTLALYLPAFKWLIHDHWWRFGGSLLGVLPLGLSVYWLRRLLQEFPRTTAGFSWGASLAVAFGFWLLLAGWSAEASAIMGWSCALVIPSLAWLYGGRAALRLAWFPAFCLAMAFPVPGLVEHHLGLYARLWSAGIAKVLLGLTGMELQRAGTFLTTASGVSLDVGNACSGVKTMHVFLASALLLLQPLRRQPLRFFALLPLFFIVSVLANGIRVSALVLIAEKLDPKWLEGASHELTGLVFFLLTFLPLAYAISRWGNKVNAPEPVGTESTVEAGLRPLKAPLLVHGFLLLVTIGFFVQQARQWESVVEINPPELPYLLADWSGRDVILAAHEVQFYGVSGLRKRLYLSGTNQVEYVSNTAPVSREGLHEPTGCFTSFGWRLLARGEMKVTNEGGDFPAVILKLDRPAAGVQQLVLFWFADGKGRSLATERELTWHVFQRRLQLQAEEVWTLHSLALPVNGDDWETARRMAEDLARRLHQATQPVRR